MHETAIIDIWQLELKNTSKLGSFPRSQEQAIKNILKMTTVTVMPEVGINLVILKRTLNILLPFLIIPQILNILYVFQNVYKKLQPLE